MRSNKNYLLPPMVIFTLIAIVLVILILDAGGTIRLEKPKWLSLGRPKVMTLNEEQGRILTLVLVELDRLIEKEEIRGNIERMEMVPLFTPRRMPWYAEEKTEARQQVARWQPAEAEKRWQW